MPAPEFTNEQFLKDIKAGIAKYGVYLVAVTDDDTQGAFVYSIGHREKQRPDILVLCRNVGNPNSAARLINHLVKEWDTKPVLSGHTVEDCDGVQYTVAMDRTAYTKKWYTAQASNYYGDDNYDVLVLVLK